MKFNKSLFIALTFIGSTALAQETFHYKRKVVGITSKQWYSIQLPGEIFEHSFNKLCDARLYSIQNNDTTEIPYVLVIRDPEYSKKDGYLTTLNESRSGDTNFLTLKNSDQALNYIELDLKEENYFATVTIEGSENRKIWLKIGDEQTIFGVSNERDRYESNGLSFPLTDYPYLRLTMKSKVPLHTQSAYYQNAEVKPGEYENIPLRYTVENNKQTKQTVVTITLDHFRPVNNLHVDIQNDGDFYRSAQIDILTDSVKTEKGWIKNYTPLSHWIVSSFRPNDSSLPHYLTKEIRLAINNNDNQPLQINGITASGAKIELRAELQNAGIFLFYGHRDLSRPSYDLEHFLDKIPATMADASVGQEEYLLLPAEPTQAIFENKVWLWAAMAVVIGLLGFFTVRMMSAKTAE